MIKLFGIQGKVGAIEIFDTNNKNELGCFQSLTLFTPDNQEYQFIISPDTFIVDQTPIRVGNTVTCYYDQLAPVPLIYPPRFNALVITKPTPYENIYVGFFKKDLVSEDNMLQLNISDKTILQLENGMPYEGRLENRNLVVIYGATTRSIPAQTTPSKVIVLCK